MEIFKDITDYMKSRLTNPFLGTLLLVLLVRNFEFIFALFNFADGVTLTQKVQYIRDYSKINITWGKFLCNALIAIVILSLTFFLLLITRAITNGYVVFTNAINKFTAKGSVVSRVEFEKELKRVQELREEREKLRNDAALAEEKARTAELVAADNLKSKIEIENQNAQLASNINELKDIIDKFPKDIEIHGVTGNNIVDSVDEPLALWGQDRGRALNIKGIIDDLERNSLITRFMGFAKEIMITVNPNLTLTRSEYNKFLELGLIETPSKLRESDNHIVSKNYRLTMMGDSVYRFIRDNR